MSDLSYPIRLAWFDDMDDQFWAHGVGAASWRFLRGLDGTTRRALAVKLPGDPELSMLFMEHAPDNWAQAGPKNGWDGHETEPTLTPSIGTDVWHGFIERGHICTARDQVR